jgi:hypothetical protein
MLTETTTAEAIAAANTMPPDLRVHPSYDSQRYARCIAVSKRVRWDIDKDVVRGRSFSAGDKFLPDGLSFVQELAFLTADERRFVSQVQGRTYANMFGLVERYINVKVLELARTYGMTDQVALEALVRFSDEELKHQELFRRIETMVKDTMPEGYCFIPKPNDVAAAVLSKGTWAVLALTLHIELFTQLHYRQSVEPDDGLSPLFKDVLLYHWKEESQHAILDELEWVRHDATIGAKARDEGVNEFIALVGAVDGILQMQASADAHYAMNVMTTRGRRLSEAEQRTIERVMLKAYRWQYILSGAGHPHFVEVLTDLTTDMQRGRIQTALATLM